MGTKKIYCSIDGIFENYFQQYIIQLEEKIEQMYNCHNLWKSQENKSFCAKTLIDGILEEIVGVASFSLIDCYTLEKENNKKITYESFNKLFIDEKYVKKFESRYPMVEKTCTQIMNNYIQRIEEVLSTISKYRNEIIEFSENYTEIDISEIDISKGDYHKNTFVAIITNNNQKIVLKKRFNIGERILNTIKDVYSEEQVQLPIIRTKILNNQLVIQEFISPDKMFNQQELCKYYYKFGLMTGIFSIIGSKDLHNENVIATKNGPYFIDMEAAITPQLGRKTYSLLKETLLFNCSEMGLVYGNSDLSAFSGKGEKIECVEIKNKGMDDIYIGFEEKRPILMNIPQNENGEDVDPIKYIAEVEKGYNHAINIFIKQREKIIALLNDLSGYNNRVVLRNTGFYGKYLFNLCLPSYMKSEKNYNKLLSLLMQKSIRDEDTISEEIDCLRKHIIPYFTINRFVPENEIKEEFLERLRNLNIDDFEREKHYLNMALSIEEYDINNSYEGYDAKERISTEIEKYVKLCVLGESLKYGARDTTIHNKILDYRNDLYTFGGALVFLSKVCPDKKRFIKNTVENNTKRKNISGLNGYHAGILLEEYLGVQSHAKYEQASELMSEYDDVDFSTYGSAIVVLDYLYRKTSCNKYLNDIYSYGEKYLKKTRNQKLTGLFHGYSGDALVMRVLKNYFYEENMYEIIENCIRKEDELYDEMNKNWLDTRDEIQSDRDMSAISYGAVGIVLSRMLLCMDKNITQNLKTICEKDILKGILKIISTPRELYVDDSLVNGYAGALLVLKLAKMMGYVSNEKLQDEVEQYLSNGIKCLAEEIWRYGEMTYIYNPSFASGRIGTLFVLWFISSEEMPMINGMRGCI